MELRYGLNPDQPAGATLDDPRSPVRVVPGHPSYINVLDALGAWQLVQEAPRALSVPVASVEVLAAKMGGRFLVLEADGAFEAPARQTREVFGIRLEQQRSANAITAAVVESGTTKPIPESAVADLMLAMVAARHTQSNTVTYARDGMVLGIGAGQQSRIDCTRLAGTKVDTWWLRRHPKVRALPFLDEVRRQE